MLTKGQVLTATIVVVISVAALGCHVSRQVQYVNQSSSTVSLWIDGVEINTISPGETYKVSHREEEGDKDRIEVYAEDGTKLLDETYAWEDFEALDFKVLIRDLDNH